MRAVECKEACISHLLQSISKSAETYFTYLNVSLKTSLIQQLLVEMTFFFGERGVPAVKQVARTNCFWVNFVHTELKCI